MSKMLVVGGNSDIGLAIVIKLLEQGTDKVYIVGKQETDIEDVPESLRQIFCEKTTSFQDYFRH